MENEKPFKIVVNDNPQCPVCGETERVRGFKVGDSKGRWWSECLGDHTDFNKSVRNGNTRRPVKNLVSSQWFCDDQVELIFSDGSVSVCDLVWEEEYENGK